MAERAGLRQRIDAMFAGEPDQPHREPGRAARRPCAPPRAARSWSTATTSCPTSTRCWDGCAGSPRRSAPAAGSATPAGGSATSSTSASAAPTWARPWPIAALRPHSDRSMTFRFVPTSTGADIAEGDPRPGPGRDPVHRLLQILHHHRDPDQRPHGQGLAAGRPRRPGAADLAAPVGRVDQRREGGRSSSGDRRRVRFYWDYKFGGHYSRRPFHRRSFNLPVGARQTFHGSAGELPASAST